MYKLTIECKNINDLSEVVGRLGSTAVSAKIETPSTAQVDRAAEPTRAEDTSGDKLTPKQKAKAEAEALGVEVSSKDTKADIEAKIAAHTSSGDLPEPPPVPQMSAAQSNNPLPPEGVVSPAAAPAAAPAFNRDVALQNIVQGFQSLQQAGYPEAQIAPLLQQELQKAGAPAVRLGELSDQHLSAAYPYIMDMINSILNASKSQSSAFV